MLRFLIFLIPLFTLSSHALSQTTWLNPGQKNGLYAYDPQYENYKDIIETPLRNLKVFDNFTLVDDFEEFMAWHHENTTEKFPDDRFLIAFQSESGLAINECLNNAKTLTGTSSVSSGISEGEFTAEDYSYEYASAQGRCQNVISQRFMNNPQKGAQVYANILKYWVENDILKNINQTTKKIPTFDSRRADFVFATVSRVGDSLAHYALYHRLYGLSKSEQKKIDAMFTSFATDYDYFSAYKASGPSFSKLCNLGKGATVTPNGGNDHCGTFKLKIAVGATLYGLEFGNQVIFDYGIRNLEVILSTFDERKAFTAQIFRGMMAMSYAREIITEIDKLDYAFEKAFNIDFSEMVTPHGVTPAEIYEELLVFANEPQKLAYYFFNNGYGGDKRGGDFNASLKQLKASKIKPDFFWGAFNLDEYFLLGGKMAYDIYPETFANHIDEAKIWQKWSIEGSHNTGFNNLVLRQATGQIPTFFSTNRSKANSKFDLLQSIEKGETIIRINWYTKYANETSRVLEASDVLIFDEMTDINSNSLTPKMAHHNDLLEDGSMQNRHDLDIRLTRKNGIKISGELHLDDEIAQIDIEQNYSKGKKTITFGPGDELTISWEKQNFFNNNPDN